MAKHFIPILILIVSTPAAWAQFTANLPQVAFGGPFSTHLTVFEPDGVSKRLAIDLFDDGGGPLEASFDGAAPVSSLTLTLGANASQVLVLTSSGPAQSGWARLSTPGPGSVSASARFLVSSEGSNRGTVLDAVGVLAAEETTLWLITFDRRNASQDVGVAAVNPSDRPLQLSYNLFTAAGDDIVPGTGTLVRTLPPKGHLALFLTELFPINFTGVGTLTVRAPSGTHFSVVALRQDGTQLSALPAAKQGFVWNWFAPATGARNVAGVWYWTDFHRDSFFGVNTTLAGGDSVTFLRGFWDRFRFVAEELITRADGTSAVVLYQGKTTITGGSAFIDGTRSEISESGAILSSQPFRAVLEGS